MGKIRINKIDAARRQIDAAIRLMFQSEDPVAVHSIGAAGARIIRDLCASRGDIETYLKFTDWIAPGREGEFWASVNRSANFFKHADNDPQHIHSMEEAETDFLIMFATIFYQDLGYAPSIEMRVFRAWFAICHPKIITPESIVAMKAAGFDAALGKMLKDALSLPRKHSLEVGCLALEKARLGL